MMKWIKLLFVFMLTLSVLQAVAFEKKAHARSLNVVLSSEKPLVVGENKMIFFITQNGKALEDVKVSIKVFMPAMPGMPAMHDLSSTIKLGEGKYQSSINFSMSGTWQIHILVTPKSGKKMRVKSSVNL